MSNVIYNPEFVRRVQARRKRERLEAARKAREEERVRRLAEICAERNESIMSARSGTLGRIAEIIEAVAAEHGVSSSAILAYTRAKKVFDARVDAVLRVKQELPRVSLPLMGRAFNRDHSTVLYILRRYGSYVAPVKEITKRFTIRLPDDHRDYLREMAEESGMPVATLVRSLIQSVVEDEKANAKGRFLRVAASSPKQEGQPR
ncbi:helix-turn-helix domain-containing protein [Aminobacter sp. MDW-2]|uniref:helix-turn-helix domain-containing protein n=1 Tax=Aminobacter sp. MDW-2 TaxID=2666139 RepID=UPI00163CD448|nr:helix-turn-helix domain-containing protein [Aminobacter sp. MDW-2]QNH32375.1 hypothetical protein H5P29_17640 [Aminobacter sp. MDW-2]